MASPAPAARPRPSAGRPLPALPIQGPSPAHAPPSSSSLPSSYYDQSSPPVNNAGGFSIRPPLVPTPRSLSNSSSASVGGGGNAPPPSRPSLSLSLSVSPTPSYQSGFFNPSNLGTLPKPQPQPHSQSQRPKLSLDGLSSSSLTNPLAASSSSSSLSSLARAGAIPPVLSLQRPGSSPAFNPTDQATGSSSGGRPALNIGIPNGGLAPNAQPRARPSMPRLNLNTSAMGLSTHPHPHHSHSNSVPNASSSLTPNLLDDTDNGASIDAGRRRSSDADSTNSSDSDFGNEYEYEEDEDVGYYGRPLGPPAAHHHPHSIHSTSDSIPTLRPDLNTMRPGGGSSSYRPPASMDDVRRAIADGNAAAIAARQHSQPAPSSNNSPPASEFAQLNFNLNPAFASSSGSGSVPMTMTSSNPVSSSLTSLNTNVSTTSIRTPWTGDDSNLEILARLGEGASGAVFKVRDRRTPSLIMAQKTVPATSATNPKALLHEYRSLSGSRHENITAFYGAFVGSGASSRFVEGNDNNNRSEVLAGQAGAPEICLLMEYCEGGSLDGVSRRIRQMGFGRVSEKVMGKIAPGILLGLDYLHSIKVIHRDIKPSNIVLTRSGVVKLCDFGVSGELVASIAETFTGTAYYMAPERIEGRPYTIRSDVWSTGLSLLEFAQNKFPYPPDLGPIDLLQEIVRGPVPQLDDDAEGGVMWSPSMKDFIKTCLTVDASARPTPGAMLEHPWIIEQQAIKVPMDKWVAQVWGWEIPASSASSSSSSHRDAKEKERRRRERSERKKASMNQSGHYPHSHHHSQHHGSAATSTGDLINMNVVLSPLGGTSSTLEGSSGGSLMSPASPRPPF